jgi:hypothetical protein
MARRISRKGQAVKELGEFLEDHVLPEYENTGRPTDQLRGFIADGVDFEFTLAAVVHGDVDARDVDRGRLSMWLKSAFRIQREWPGPSAAQK